MEAKITYFDSGGIQNTETTLRLAKERALERGIRNVIVASISGFSAQKALEVFGDTNVKLTIVSLKGFAGFKGLPVELEEKLRGLGHNVCYASDVSYQYPIEVQDAFRRLCEGFKVCVEIVLVATEAGYVKPGEEVIAIAGTGKLGYERGGGLDTAIIMEAIKSSDLLRLEPLIGGKEKRRKIKEVICKPR